MPDPDHQTGTDYLPTLLRYYEEEIMGEAYFYGLAEHFAEHEKVILLARIERHAAMAIAPLLAKYGLVPRDEATLERHGRNYIELHQSFSWAKFLAYILERYPLYLDDFAALEQMAPTEDQAPLKKLTAHEVAVIDFARMELAGDTDSLNPLLKYLN